MVSHRSEHCVHVLCVCVCVCVCACVRACAVCVCVVNLTCRTVSLYEHILTHLCSFTACIPHQLFPKRVSLLLNPSPAASDTHTLPCCFRHTHTHTHTHTHMQEAVLFRQAFSEDHSLSSLLAIDTLSFIARYIYICYGIPVHTILTD